MSGSPPTRAKLVKTIAGLHTSGALKPKQPLWCEGGGPPKGEVCKPTPAPVKAYSYNFETMQPTMSPTPQVP